jgi:hypothetical protein
MHRSAELHWLGHQSAGTSYGARFFFKAYYSNGLRLLRRVCQPQDRFDFERFEKHAPDLDAEDVGKQEGTLAIQKV